MPSAASHSATWQPAAARNRHLVGRARGVGVFAMMVGVAIISGRASSRTELRRSLYGQVLVNCSLGSVRPGPWGGLVKGVGDGFFPIHCLTPSPGAAQAFPSPTQLKGREQERSRARRFDARLLLLLGGNHPASDVGKCRTTPQSRILLNENELSSAKGEGALHE